MLGVAAMAVLLSTLTRLTADGEPGRAGVPRRVLAAADDRRRPARSSPTCPRATGSSFVDLFRDPILWRDVERGVALQAVYVVVLLGAAWANFTTKDITS